MSPGVLEAAASLEVNEEELADKAGEDKPFAFYLRGKGKGFLSTY